MNRSTLVGQGALSDRIFLRLPLFLFLFFFFFFIRLLKGRQFYTHSRGKNNNMLCLLFFLYIYLSHLSLISYHYPLLCATEMIFLILGFQQKNQDSVSCLASLFMSFVRDLFLYMQLEKREKDKKKK